MSGHTPGPWKSRVRMNTHGGWMPEEQVVEVWAGKQLVAYYTISTDEFPSYDENKANARLIAASPIMAAYLQELADAGDARASEIMESIHAAS